MGSAIKDVTDASFQADVLQAAGPVVVCFWSRQSGNMWVQAPGDVPGHFSGGATIVRMDGDANAKTWNTYRDTGDYVYDERNLPTLVMFRNGQPGRGLPVLLAPVMPPQVLLATFIAQNAAGT